MSIQVLVCSTPTMNPDPVPGSVVRWCSLCAEELWVSPNSLAKVNAGELDPICHLCVDGFPDEVHVELLPDDAKLLGPVRADQVRRFAEHEMKKSQRRP